MIKQPRQHGRSKGLVDRKVGNYTVSFPEKRSYGIALTGSIVNDKTGLSESFIVYRKDVTATPVGFSNPYPLPKYVREYVHALAVSKREEMIDEELVT